MLCWALSMQTGCKPRGPAVPHMSRCILSTDSKTYVIADGRIIDMLRCRSRGLGVRIQNGCAFRNRAVRIARIRCWKDHTSVLPNLQESRENTNRWTIASGCCIIGSLRISTLLLLLLL